MDSNNFVDFHRLILFSYHFQLPHLCNVNGCHGYAMWLCFIESRRKLILVAKYDVNRMNCVESRGEGSD